jgi:hypothetical protein
MTTGITINTYSPTPIEDGPVRVINEDKGGHIIAYVEKYLEWKRENARVQIMGDCISACTMLTGIVSSDRVCVGPKASLQFHAAGTSRDGGKTQVANPDGSRKIDKGGTEILRKIYPANILRWIDRNGGLSNKMLVLKGKELHRFYRAC